MALIAFSLQSNSLIKELMSIRVFIADDHPIVRDGLRMTIERNGEDMVMVGEASDGMEVLEAAKKTPADVYVLDITMPNMNGIETARELLKLSPSVKIIILSLYDTKVMVDAALDAGVHGYLTKETGTRNLVDAIREVCAGHYYLSPNIAHYLVEGLNKKKKSSQAPVSIQLTGQERKVLQLIAEGQSNKEIADKLDLSANTIHAHRNNVMAKLNIHKQADLVRYALKEGIAKL